MKVYTKNLEELRKEVIKFPRGYWLIFKFSAFIIFVLSKFKFRDTHFPSFIFVSDFAGRPLDVPTKLTIVKSIKFAAAEVAQKLIFALFAEKVVQIENHHNRCSSLKICVLAPAVTITSADAKDCQGRKVNLFLFCIF